MKMKIAVFSDCFTPMTNGVVTATMNLVKGLADKGHQVLLATPYLGKENTLNYKNIMHLTCWGVPAIFHDDFRITAPLKFALLKSVRAFNPDLIHFQTPWTIGMQAVIISRLLHKPLVGTFHTHFSEPDYLKNVGMNNRYAANVAERYSLLYYNRCNLVTAPSHATVSDLRKGGYMAPVIYISNGIDSSVSDHSKSGSCRAKFADQDTLLFIYVGRIAPEKNIIFLLKAFQDVIAKNRNCKLVLVGDGSETSAVQRFIDQQKLSDEIVMTGRIPHEELVSAGYFGAADVFITASKTENQPMTVLEAQQNGLPCIGLEAKGMPDLIKHDYNGLLSPVDDLAAFTFNINRIVNEQGLLDQLKRGTLQSISKHSLAKVINEWEEAYGDVIRIYNTKRMVS